MYEKKLPIKKSKKYPRLVASIPHKTKVEVTHKIQTPEVQKVEVLNPTVQQLVVFPEKQKVEVINQPAQKDIVFPDIQKVEVLNPTPETKVEFPEVQKVEVTNPTPIQKLDIPIGKGNIAGQADPETGAKVESEVEVIDLTELRNRKRDVLKELDMLNRQIALFK